MKKCALLLFLASIASHAADVHFTWLRAVNALPGLPAPASVQYGAQVLMDSDNPKVTEFQVTVVAQMPNGEIVTNMGTAPRDGRVANARYSTAYVAWFGPDPGFEVLSIQVKANVGKSATKPSPGSDYSSDVGGSSL